MLISSASIHNRLVQLAIAAVVLVGLFWLYLPTSYQPTTRLNDSHVITFRPSIKVKPNEAHPISQLFLNAQGDFRSLVAKESKTLRDAAKAYRERRGRQPPPGFDVWFQFAKDNSALVVEDFFDRIYEDLEPFWGVSAKQIREQANDFEHRISVRDGKVRARTDTELKDRPWMILWSEMVESVANHLPDLDLPINVMDESRVVVPWEEINEYMIKANKTRRIVPEEQLKTTFGTDLKALDLHPPEPFDPHFRREGPYWKLAVVGCHPFSPARQAYIDTDFTKLPAMETGWPEKSYQGYVQNWTHAKSPCEHKMLQGLHGTFVEPLSIATTAKFMPMFGGSKLPMNNEILLPPAMYWTDDPFYSGGQSHGDAWESKQDSLVWRGAASGGRNRENNWIRFQRHRFVSMLNATSIEQVEDHPDQPPRNFVLPRSGSAYELSVHVKGAGDHSHSDWVSTWADAAFVHLLCFPDLHPPHCPYTDPYFSVASTMPMETQYVHKYLPDLDGNSFSGRYRGFLGSTSVPIKATIYDEWHDSRLMPWKHFVPMDNSFVDIYGIMEYFIGNQLLGLKGHDEVARHIALEGKAWAEKVLRKEDMSVYVLRLLLEYARLCDDDREVLGWSEAGKGVT